MMSLTFGLFTQVSDSGPQGPLVFSSLCDFPFLTIPPLKSKNPSIILPNGIVDTITHSFSSNLYLVDMFKKPFLNACVLLWTLFTLKALLSISYYYLAH